MEMESTAMNASKLHEPKKAGYVAHSDHQLPQPVPFASFIAHSPIWTQCNNTFGCSDYSAFFHSQFDIAQQNAPIPESNSVAHSPNWNQHSNPSGSNDYGDSTDSQSNHSQQNDVPRETATVHDRSIKEQEETTRSSSKGSRGPRRSIINKLKKWNPLNCCGFATKHE